MAPQVHFNYARQFLLLTCFGLGIGAMARMQLEGNPSISFATYGALHGSALILSLRNPLATWRKLAFLPIAAALSASTLHIGMFVVQSFGTLPVRAVLYAVLGFSAATGAATYGIALRLMGIHRMSLAALAMTCAYCFAAVDAALFFLAYAPYLGRWCLAISWWYAFSGGMRQFDTPQPR
jgi:hypothetical protein